MPLVSRYCTQSRLPSPVVAGKVNVPVLSRGLATQSDPDTWEAEGDTVANEQVTMQVLSRQFGFNNPDRNKGFELRLLLASHLTQLEQSIQSRINAIITEGNIASATATASSGSYLDGVV
jgi:hypothetical protein